MWPVLKRLSLGLSLIAAASVILLLSDPPRRTESLAGNHPASATSSGAASKPTRQLKVAMVQMASQAIIEDGAAGVLTGLAERGFSQDKEVLVKRYNAEGDTAAINAMAQEVTSGGFDLVITLTTPALQAVANANKSRGVPHVFGMVTDPRKTGVGINDAPLDHPAHLVGIGTLPPAAESIRIAKGMNPGLKRLGVVWNPAEINSQICTTLARQACGELGIELLEANADNTSAVNETALSLVQRGVDALWIGGDVTVLAAVETIVRAGRTSKVPVFTCIPGNAAKGTLFDVGANYLEVGRSVGHLAAKVLAGESIAKLPVEMAIPPKLVLNETALKGLPAGWKFSPELVAKADTLIDASGTHEKKPKPALAPDSNAPLAKKWQIQLLAYVNTFDVEESQRGLQDGLKKAGLVAGRDFDLRINIAQGDMLTLHNMVDSAVSAHSDLLLTISTQALQSCMQRNRSTPAVFTMVANPFLTGVAKNNDDHYANFTGAYGANDAAAMMTIIRQLLPKAKRLGALFVPGELNSVYSHDLLLKAAKDAGYEVVSLGVNGSTEIPDAAASLCGDSVDLLCLPNSNLIGSSFPSISQAARKARLPVFTFLGSTAKQGASVVLSRDYYEMGIDAGQLAARVMRGQSPASIPLHQNRTNRLILNPGAAEACGLSLPEAFVNTAHEVIGK
jgi:ABC-type uncharacterized transport system substrate-binding protein